jgi:putative hydrolase
MDYAMAVRAVEAGCLFALDSDAHAPAQLSYAETAIAHARLASIPTERVINCWPRARLLEWLEARRARSSRRHAL